MTLPAAGDDRVAATQPVPLLDIQRENQQLHVELLSAIERVCESGRFVLGPECVELEESMSALCGASHGIGCASGSDALLLALMALDIGPGDEVITPSFTFFATASAAWRLGAKPVFVDIDPVTFNIDPAKIEPAITKNTKAIIPVHLFGQSADMKAICEIASRHDIRVIEDVAQAIGAQFDGRPAGSFGDVGCFSYYPTKNLGGFGDGGMMVTSDDLLAERLRLLRGHGMHPRYFHSIVGVNSRLDSMQAAVLNVKLPHLEAWTQMRKQNALRYTEWINQVAPRDAITTPVALDHCDHVWNQYTIRVHHGRRDDLRAHLAERHIGTEIYYPVPLHLQKCFQMLGYKPGDLPETEKAAAEVVSLPIFPELTAAEQRAVVDGIADFHQSADAARRAG